jgi:hypothetical protein
VAVTVTQAPFVVLDEGDRIVGVGPDAESQFGPLVGSLMWDCFPGSEALFKPYYDAARRSGAEVEFVQFYDGNVARIRAVPGPDDTLQLYWELLARLDTLTLDGLAQTLEASLRLLDAEHAGAHRNALRASLRVIEGGV